MKFPREIENAIADFRGLPRPNVAYSSAPMPLDSLMEVLVERHHIGKIRPEQSIMENWRDIVGQRSAHRCSPERIDVNNVLMISVGNPILRRELQFDRNRILARIRALPGCGGIQGIEFRAG